MEFFEPLIIGHRGSKSTVMENTLESVLHAIELGVDAIEIDVYKCFTGELIVFHDETLDRTVFKDDFYFKNVMGKKIHELQWFHFYNSDLINNMGRRYKIPKLIDMLKHPFVYSSDIFINIELKDKRSHEDLSNLLIELINDGLYNDFNRFLISSVHSEPLIYLKEFQNDLEKDMKNYENLKLGKILCPESLIDNNLSLSIKSCFDIVTHLIFEKTLFTLLESDTKLSELIKDKKIFLYTINDKTDPILLKKGYQGIITDKPELFSV